MNDYTSSSIFELTDQVVVITGGAGLLGRQHAEAIAAFGGHPVLLDLDGDAVEGVSQELNEKYGVQSKGFSVDITKEDEVEANKDFVLTHYGRVDGLVNNAANNPKVEANESQSFSRLEKFPAELWEQDLAVGLTGAFFCCKYFGPIMAQRKKGSIVNISSDLGLIGPDQRLYMRRDRDYDDQPVKPVTYSVVKTGLIGLTRYIATYWADRNVRCNALCPGGVEAGQSEDFLDMVSSRIPMQRLARADEYQGTLIWLLSEASSYLNGSVIAVDGGRTAW